MENERGEKMKVFKRLRTLEMIYSGVILALLIYMLVEVSIKEVEKLILPVSLMLAFAICLDATYFILSFKKTDKVMVGIECLKSAILFLGGTICLILHLQNHYSDALLLFWSMANGCVIGTGTGCAFTATIRYLTCPERQERINRKCENY